MILISIGSNLPDQMNRTPTQIVLQATTAIANLPSVKVTKTSRLWHTAPVPKSDQAWYINRVIAVETSKSPLALLHMLLGIEAGFGRIRDQHWGSRILDLDLITYNDEIINSDELTIPHVFMTERNFVLLPMSDLMTNWQHPISKLSLIDLINNIDTNYICRSLPLITEN